jgi:hypothetical protein
MAEQCDLVRTQTEEACIQGTGGWTTHRRVIQTLWCVESSNGQGYERTICGDWTDTGAACGPSNLKLVVPS